MTFTAPCKAMTLLSLSFLFSNFHLVAQTPSSTKAIKLYSNFISGSFPDIHTRVNDSTTIVTSTKNIQAGFWSPAYRLQRPSGNYHEFELSQLTINNERSLDILVRDGSGHSYLTDGGSATDIAIALRYEYTFAISAEEKKLQALIGLSIKPYFELRAYWPRISTGIPTSASIYGSQFALVPRIIYNIKGNWFLDLNASIIGIDSHWTSIKAANSVPVENRTVRNSQIEVFPRSVHIRFGTGLKI